MRTRSEARKFVNLYNKEQKNVLDVRPGITDYASIEYRNKNEILAQSNNAEKTYIEVVIPHKLELIRKYMANPSLMHDIKLIFKTLSIILK